MIEKLVFGGLIVFWLGFIIGVVDAESTTAPKLAVSALVITIVILLVFVLIGVGIL